MSQCSSDSIFWPLQLKLQIKICGLKKERESSVRRLRAGRTAGGSLMRSILQERQEALNSTPRRRPWPPPDEGGGNGEGRASGGEHKGQVRWRRGRQRDRGWGRLGGGRGERRRQTEGTRGPERLCDGASTHLNVVDGVLQPRRVLAKSKGVVVPTLAGCIW